MKNIEQAQQELIDYLITLPLSVLRVLGRQAGLAQGSSLHKEILIEQLSEIYVGKRLPPPRSNRGAPAKLNYVDPETTAKIDEIRKAYDLMPHFGVSAPYFGVAPDAPPPERNEYDAPVNTGILEITQNGYGFLRARNCQPSNDGDVFVSAPTIHTLKLREGDRVTCTSRPRPKTDYTQKTNSAAFGSLMNVNGLTAGQYEQRPFFDALTAKYADERFELSANNGDLSLRILDLFVPIGKGQRALIIAPPKAGKTTLLKSVAGSISQNYPNVCLIILLIDERPEEVTDIRAAVPKGEVIYSTFDDGVDHHIRAASLTLAHAKRMAEIGKDVVILLDSLTKLTRAYNYAVESSGKTLSGGLDAGALAEPKRFFGAARNTVEAGSITILATALVETGSRMDDIIYEEFKGTGNADIFLSRDLAERRIFPAIDIRKSGTRKEELLLKKEELEAVYKMRERGLTDNAQGLHEMLKRTKTNEEFVARLPEWLRIFKNS